jgi:hypothetical protein
MKTSWAKILTSNSVIMGKELTERLNPKTGNKIWITGSKGYDFIITLSRIIKTGHNLFD